VIGQFTDRMATWSASPPTATRLRAGRIPLAGFSLHDHDRAVTTETRLRRSDDLDACVAALAAVHARAGYPSNWPADPAAWLSPTGTIHAWVAVAGGRVVGHALIRDLAGSTELARLFVVPQAHGQGIAGDLLSMAYAWADAHAVDLTLEVNTDLAAAIRRYEKDGWVQLDETVADWTGPHDETVILRRYTRISADHRR